MSRVGDLSSGSGSTNHYSAHKVSKDDSGRFSGLLSSSGSPSRVGFSRSSSRFSLQDELDDIDFSSETASNSHRRGMLAEMVKGMERMAVTVDNHQSWRELSLVVSFFDNKQHLPATDPFRAFPVLTDNPNNNNKKRMHPPQQQQQQQQRPHSWSSARGPPPFTQFGSPSPPAFRSSSGRYDLSSSPTDVVYGQRMRPPTTTHTSFDDYQLSPPFSPSPSPSPPTY
nr:autophagy-related protein 13 [Tanacetum cinerariifolium]